MLAAAAGAVFGEGTLQEGDFLPAQWRPPRYRKQTRGPGQGCPKRRGWRGNAPGERPEPALSPVHNPYFPSKAALLILGVRIRMKTPVARRTSKSRDRQGN